jgi:chemotaxis signal transduction protein
MIYKGIEIDEKLGRLIRHMDSVEEYRDELQRLQSVWDNLTLLGQLSGTRADMSTTRQAFHGLTESLLNQLGTETLRKAVLEISSTAQVAIDILVRNLYERTADIGFLATDDDVRRYVEHAVKLSEAVVDDDPDGSASRGEELAALNAGLRKRFEEYVAKYSVYSNIIVLDTKGRVLLALDDRDLPERTENVLLTRSLDTSDNYVETFGNIDLVPGEEKSLVYSFRITDAAQRKTLGAICLVFRLQNEAAGIFSKLAESEDWLVITYLDREGRVIASSDESQVRIGIHIPPAEGEWKLVKFGGREYLAATRATKGYQGYMGPGWFGHVMVPVEYAFAQTDGGLEVSEEVLGAVTRHSALFGESLRAIPLQAKHIQRGLNRSVWNGNIHKGRSGQDGNQSFSKVILWEISNTGAKTKAVFEQSISNLNQTVVSAIVQDSLFQASLAIDIMDRNLYERANDCRWWALTTDFRRTLDAGRVGEPEQQRIESILKYINSLYTVYSNLIVYDDKGVVVAVSNDAYRGVVGHTVGAEWVRRSLSLGTPQEYVVSQFEATPLYENRPTYIYAAAIRDPSGARVVGGVGIVFDAAPQFEAMLLDSLPKNESGAIPEGCFGAFVDRNGLVVSATSAKLAAGSRAGLPPELLNLSNGEGVARIVHLDGVYYAVGSRMSSGYREYKGSEDRYRNDVAGLVFFPLCQEDGTTATKPLKTLKIASAEPGQPAVEVATFHVGQHWYGMRAESVLEAIDSKAIAGSPRSSKDILGYLMYEGNPIAVIDFSRIESGEPNSALQDGQIIIVKSSRGKVGILVDGLGDIPEVAEAWIQPIPAALVAEGSSVADAIVRHPRENQESEVLVVVSAERIVERAGK